MRAISVGCVLLLAFCIPAVAKEKVLDLEFGMEDLKVGEQEGYATVKLKGCSAGGDEGTPKLPSKMIRLLVTMGSKVSYEVISVEREEVKGTHKVIPMPPLMPVKGGDWGEIVFDEAKYHSQERYPEKIVEYLGTGYGRGNTLATFRIRPVEYYPKQGRLVLVTKIRLKLTYEAPGKANLEGKKGPTFLSFLKEQKHIRQTVVNPEDSPAAGYFKGKK